jgi:hypothetical protein
MTILFVSNALYIFSLTTESIEKAKRCDNL